MEVGSSPASATNVFSNSNSPKPRQKCSKARSQQQFAWATRYEPSNRYRALTPTQSVVRVAVARRVLSTSETYASPEEARCGSAGDVSHAFQSSSSTERTPKKNVAPQLSPFAGSLAVAFRRASQESSLSGVCLRLVYVKNPGSAFSV